MYVTTVQTPVIESGQDLFPVFVDSLGGALEERTIVCVTSKVVAVEQGRVVKLADVQPSAQAFELKSERITDDPEHAAQFAELVLREADRVFDHLSEPGYVFLTLKDNILLANSGIDLSNIPQGYAVLWPEQPWAWAERFRQRLRAQYQVDELGVLLTDSHVKPLRRGVTGVAVAYAGFVGVESAIGEQDLYGNILKFTERAVADSLAATAVFMIGESAERTPFALIQDPPVTFTDTPPDPADLYFAPKYDLYAGIYNSSFGKAE